MSTLNCVSPQDIQRSQAAFVLTIAEVDGNEMYVILFNGAIIFASADIATTENHRHLLSVWNGL